MIYRQKTKKRVFLTLLILVLCLISRPMFANEEAPIHISADRMTSSENDNSVIFTGDVDAKQGDVRIRTDQMIVYYSEAGNRKKQKVDKLICTGNVEVTRGEWLGTGKKMTYLAEKQLVILTGNAKAWQDQNMVSGSQILYYINQGRSEVIGGDSSSSSSGNGRVHMTIIQK